MPCSPVPIPGPFLPVWFYSFLEIHKHFYSLSKPDDALGGRSASLVCNISHAYHFYDCAPPPRLPSYAGPPRAPGTTHDSFSQVCACGRRHTARVAHGLCLLYYTSPPPCSPTVSTARTGGPKKCRFRSRARGSGLWLPLLLYMLTTVIIIPDTAAAV